MKRRCNNNNTNNENHDNNNNKWKKNWLNTSWCISSWTCAYFGDNDMSSSSSVPFFACCDDDLSTESLIIAHFVTIIQMADLWNSSRSLLQLLSELICPCVTGFYDVYREKYINYRFSCQEPGTVCNAQARQFRWKSTFKIASILEEQTYLFSFHLKITDITHKYLKLSCARLLSKTKRANRWNRSYACVCVCLFVLFVAIPCVLPAVSLEHLGRISNQTKDTIYR